MSTQGQFIQEDIDFLNDLNSGEKEESRVGLTVKHGYVRNLDRDKLQQFENIYKRVINPAFVLCFHCSTDVLNMIRELYEAFEATQVEPDAQNPQDPPAEDPAPRKKSTRKK